MTISEGNLSSDRPIVAKVDDKLGYANFARLIAVGIGQRYLRDSLVMGIQAEWGMGKTSCINLICEELREVSDKTRVVRFEPWLFSSFDELAKSYIVELTRAVGVTLESQRAPALKSLGRKAVKAADSLAAPAGAAINLAFPGVGTLISSSVQTAIKPLTKSLGQPSLVASITELKTALAQTTDQILVIVDDLDRLHPSALYHLLSLIKTFGDMPNVVHMLSYDKRIVNEALEAHLSIATKGPNYLDKIVNVTADIPPPSEAHIQSLLVERVASALGSVPFQSEAFDVAWESGLRYIVRTPRDVIRVANAIQITSPGIAEQVDIVEFIVLECLRILEPGFYRAIWTNRRRLLGIDITPFGSPQERRADLRRRLEQCASEGRGEAMMELLEPLFPVLEEFSSEDYRMRNVKRSVGHSTHFDSYFTFRPSGRPPIKAVREFIADGDEEDKAGEHINRWGRAEHLSALFNDAHDLVDTEKRQAFGLLRALMKIGDELILREKDSYRTYNQSIFQSIDRLVVSLIAAADPVSREKEIEIGLKDAAVTIPAIIWQRAALPLGKLSSANNPDARRFLTAEQVDELAVHIREHILKAEEEGRLMSSPLLGWILTIWSDAGARDQARSAFAKALRSPNGVVALIENCASIGSAQRTIRFFGMEMPTFIQVCRDHLSRIDLSDSDRKFIERFVSAAENNSDFGG